MTDRNSPRQPPRPLPAAADFKTFRPYSERGDQQLPTLGARPPVRPRPPGQQRPARLPDPERRSIVPRLLLWAGLGLAGLAAAGAAALMIWSPAGLVRDQLIQRVKVKTGRDLVIAGPTSLTFYPSLAISMADVSLSPPPGMAGAPTITMRSLAASVPLLPLLQRQVTVERLSLHKPVIELRIDAQGRRSWDVAAIEPPQRVQLAQAQTGAGRHAGQMPKELQDFVKQSSPDSREATVSRGALGALESLSLSDVRIEGGTVRYADERSGVSEEVRSVDAQLALASITGPLAANGSFVWRSEPISFETKLTSPKQLLEERPARLTLKLAGRPADIAWDGTLTLGRGAEAEGLLTAKSPSLKALVALLGGGELDAPGFGAASISGRLKANEAAVSLADATAQLDNLTAQGTITVEARSARLLLRGNVQLSELDLNNYALPNVTAAAAPPAAPAPASKARAPATAPSSKPAQSIEDLLRQGDPAAAAGTRVRGFARRTGWSDEPINLLALRLVDADLKLGLGRLIFREIKVGQTQMRVVLKDRALTAHFDDVQLYDGRGRGLLTLDGTGAQAVLGANFSVDGASALPLLKDAANFDWLSGRGKVNLAIGGQGFTERQIVSTLQGKADVAFKDGAVIGYNVPQVLRGIMQGKFAGLVRSPAEKTDFSEMAASFTITNGVAQNKDLRLVSPLIRITGAGQANMPERTLDYTLRPKLVAAAAGQAGAVESSSLEIPVKLTGSWDRPAIAPDIDGVLNNPDQAVDAIKQLGRQLKNGDGEAVNKAKDLLNQLLRR